MAYIEDENFEKNYGENREKMNQGDIFFMPLLNIVGLGVYDIDADSKDDTIDTVLYMGGDNELSAKEEMEIYPDKGLELLVAVKYLGNGIFEEMVTGEKMLTSGASPVFKNENDEKNGKVIEVPRNESRLILDYNDYLAESTDETKLSKYEYYQLLQSWKKRNVEFPLGIFFDGYCREITDESKKEYLKYTDEDRKKYILQIKKMALLDANNTNSVITEYMEKMKEITSEDVEVAYLDNQLFDFEKRGRSK